LLINGNILLQYFEHIIALPRTEGDKHNNYRRLIMAPT
jgi:hypothetical protein